MNKSPLLILIIVILVGALAYLYFEERQPKSTSKMSDSMSEVIDSAGDGVKEFQEEVIDEIDDNTNSR